MDLVRFVHHSAREYLTRHRYGWTDAACIAALLVAVAFTVAEILAGGFPPG